MVMRYHRHYTVISLENYIYLNKTNAMILRLQQVASKGVQEYAELKQGGKILSTITTWNVRSLY